MSVESLSKALADPVVEPEEVMTIEAGRGMNVERG
jgi:hypothetical protein